jgi:hypothetical protein
MSDENKPQEPLGKNNEVAENLNQANKEAEEIKKLKKEWSDYSGIWPVFFIIGVTFFVIGLQDNTTYMILGITFTTIGISWIAIAQDAKKKLQAKGIDPEEDAKIKKNEAP